MREIYKMIIRKLMYSFILFSIAVLLILPSLGEDFSFDKSEEITKCYDTHGNEIIGVECVEKSIQFDSISEHVAFYVSAIFAGIGLGMLLIVTFEWFLYRLN